MNPLFSQVFAKNSLIKNIFEEEKKFDSRTLFWEGGGIVSYLEYLGQSEDFKLTTELSEKVQYPHNRQPSSIRHHHHPSGIHIMNVDYVKFPKKFDSRTISRELP